METQCNYPIPVTPQSLSICQSCSTPEARGIFFAIKHIILLPKGILKTLFLSIEESAFHPLPLKEPAERSQRYLWPGLAAPKYSSQEHPISLLQREKPKNAQHHAGDCFKDVFVVYTTPAMNRLHS